MKACLANVGRKKGKGRQGEGVTSQEYITSLGDYLQRQLPYTSTLYSNTSWLWIYRTHSNNLIGQKIAVAWCYLKAHRIINLDRLEY